MEKASGSGLADASTMDYISMITETPNPGRKPTDAAASGSWNSGGPVATRGRKKMTTATAETATTKATATGISTAIVKSTKSAGATSMSEITTLVTKTKSRGGSTMWFTQPTTFTTISSVRSQTATSVLATPTIATKPSPEANGNSAADPKLIIIIPSVVGAAIITILLYSIIKACLNRTDTVRDGETRLANRWDPTYGQTAHSPSAEEDVFPFGRRAPCPLPRPEGIQNGNFQQNQDEYQLQDLTPTHYGGGTHTEVFPYDHDRGSVGYSHQTITSQRSYVAYQPEPQHQQQLQPAELPGDSYIQPATTAEPFSYENTPSAVGTNIRSPSATETYFQSPTATGNPLQSPAAPIAHAPLGGIYPNHGANQE